MLIRCSTCRKRIPMGWLLLGMPWSKHTCARCGTVFSGTVIRTVLISISTGFLGYLLIGTIKGKISLFFVPPMLAVTLAFLFLNLPKQIKKVGEEVQSDHT